MSSLVSTNLKLVSGPLQDRLQCLAVSHNCLTQFESLNPQCKALLVADKIAAKAYPSATVEVLSVIQQWQKPQQNVDYPIDVQFLLAYLRNTVHKNSRSKRNMISDIPVRDASHNARPWNMHPVGSCSLCDAMFRHTKGTDAKAIFRNVHKLGFHWMHFPLHDDGIKRQGDTTLDVSTDDDSGSSSDEGTEDELEVVQSILPSQSPTYRCISPELVASNSIVPSEVAICTTIVSPPSTVVALPPVELVPVVTPSLPSISGESTFNMMRSLAQSIDALSRNMPGNNSNHYDRNRNNYKRNDPPENNKRKRQQDSDRPPPRGEYRNPVQYSSRPPPRSNRSTRGRGGAR
jgi:hypothetical protein